MGNTSALILSLFKRLPRYLRPVVLRDPGASELPGGLVKTPIVEPHPGVLGVDSENFAFLTSSLSGDPDAP